MKWHIHWANKKRQGGGKASEMSRWRSRNWSIWIKSRVTHLSSIKGLSITPSLPLILQLVTHAHTPLYACHCVWFLLANIRNHSSTPRSIFYYLKIQCLYLRWTKNELSELQKKEKKRRLDIHNSLKHWVELNIYQRWLIIEEDYSDAVVWQHKAMFCLNYAHIWRVALSEQRANKLDKCLCTEMAFS